jgi:hypothetical protein
VLVRWDAGALDVPGSRTCAASPAGGAPVRLTVTVSDTEGSYTFQPEQDS